MDAEKLRATYNAYFSGGKNLWTSTDRKKTKKVARQVLTWIRSVGFSENRTSVLDVGCATGYYTEAFRQLGCEATGLDYADVAVQQAAANFPLCRFVQMNGFEPVFTEKFDLVFCRGFSGANTHDLSFIATWVNKYIHQLSEGGFFVLGYSSNFSGVEKVGETVNLSKQEIQELIEKVNAVYCGMHIFHYFGWLSQLKKNVTRTIFRRKEKDYFYLLFRNR